MSPAEILKEKLEEIKGLREDALKKVSDEYDPQIYKLGIAIGHLESICPSCNGTGNERYCDAAGDMDDRDCSACNGIGKRRIVDKYEVIQIYFVGVRQNGARMK